MNEGKKVIRKLTWVIIILSLALTTSIVARSSSLSPSKSRADLWAKVDPTGQSVVFWHPYTGNVQIGLQEIINEFNTNNQWDITVTEMYKGSYRDIHDQMIAAIATGDTPDLVVAYQNDAATYQLSNALLDMTSLVGSRNWGLIDGDIVDIFPGFWKQDIFSYYDNARLGFPPNRSVEILYFNQDWIEELGYAGPPATPDEFHDMACDAAAQPFSGGSGEGSIGYLLAVDGSRFATWTFAFSGDIFDTSTTQYTFNSPEAIAAMTFLQGLFDEGCADFTTYAYQDMDEFAEGDELFSITSSAGLPYYRSAVEAGAQFDWSVGANGHTTEDPSVNLYGPSISMPKHTPQSELAAWLFLKYFTSTEPQVDWVWASSYFPVRQSTVDDLDPYFTANPEYAEAFELLPYSKSEPSVPFYDAVRDMVVVAMTDIMLGADVVTTLNSLNVNANATIP